MAFGTAVAADIGNAVLDWYMRGPAKAQTLQDKPLLRILNETKKTFPAGKQFVATNVRGAYMENAAPVQGEGGTFFAGYTEGEQLSFTQDDNIQQAKYPWYETHAGIVITWTELKKSGITINDGSTVSRHSGAELAVITDLLEERYASFAEAYARKKNEMFWKDGSQDSQQVPGILSLITDTPAVGLTGNINRATYSWWRNHALVGGTKLTGSGTDQSLTKGLRKEMIQLRRYGGKPTRALCGSDFLESMRLEIHEKGVYTQTGFTGTQDVSMGTIRIDGLTFEYDPTLDDMGLSKRCYFIDTNTLRLRPMEGEDDKLSFPERPYDYAILLKSMFWTGTLETFQLNSQAVVEVA